MAGAIEDYGLIGDSRSAALVSRDGSIDWLCWPRFDSRSVFARLLDAERGGHFAIRPAAPFRTTRRYVGESNVLETTFTTDGGVVKLVDLMPAAAEHDKRRELLPFRQLLRRAECVEGEVAMTMEYRPRPNYARTTPRLSQRGASDVSCEDGPEVWYLRTDVALEVERTEARAALTMRGGERRYFALAYETHAPAVLPQLGAEADAVVERTLAFWQQWASHLTYRGPYRDAVLRSVLVLKLLAYAPSGGIVAAPTTSLPEQPGGVRNWDYRFCWLRDASFTVDALYDCGFDVEGAAFVDWLIYATRLTQPGLQILYDVFGESRLPESTLDHLTGWRNSRPVRIGNGAHDQFQLDVYGEVLAAIDEFTERGEHLSRDTHRLVCKLADIVCERWREPDSGIWEKRSGLQQHVHAKVMAWAALDCAIALAEKGRLGRHAARRVGLWRREREAIREVVLTRGFDAKQGSFVSVLDGDELDASLLYIARTGFLAGDDPRLSGTIDAIRRKLGHEDLVYRYELRTDDGLPPGEGAFLPCSMWLVEALAVARRFDEARAVFDQVLRRGNDLGLFSEEMDVESGTMLGNFPQALTHIGILNAALRLEEPETKRGVVTVTG